MEEKNINNLRLGLKITFNKKQRRINNLFVKTFLNYIIFIMLIIMCLGAGISILFGSNDLLTKILICSNFCTSLVVIVNTANGFSPISGWGRFSCFQSTAYKVEREKILDENVIQKYFIDTEKRLKELFKTVIKAYLWLIVMQLSTIYLFRGINKIIFYSCLILVGYSLLNIWLRNVYFDVNAEVRIVPKE